MSFFIWKWTYIWSYKARIWEILEGICKKFVVELWKKYMRSYYSYIANWRAQWTTTMHVSGCILCAKSCSCFECRFPDLPVFNAAKNFSPRNYPSNDRDWITTIKLSLERILLKIRYTKEENDMCKGKLLEFTETLRHECENKKIFEAWHVW